MSSGPRVYWEKSEGNTTKTALKERAVVEPLKDSELQPLRSKLSEGWELVNNHHLEKEFKFDDFKGAMAFTVQVGKVAEKEGHHPDILLTWGRVKLTLLTHKIDGLTEKDFLLAAQLDKISL